MGSPVLGELVFDVEGMRGRAGKRWRKSPPGQRWGGTRPATKKADSREPAFERAKRLGRGAPYFRLSMNFV